MSQFVNPQVVKVGEHKFNDRELLRAIRQGIAAEEEATHLYEVIADSTDNEIVKKVMQDVAKEEKVHVHEFQQLLNMLDPEEEESKDQAEDEVGELSGEVSEDVEININNCKYLIESGDIINVLTEAAVHRRYLLVSDGKEDRCFSPASANDNYMIYFLDRLCKSRRFNNGKYKSKIVRKIPDGCKKMSLETFLKELIPVPEKNKK